MPPEISEQHGLHIDADADADAVAAIKNKNEQERAQETKMDETAGWPQRPMGKRGHKKKKKISAQPCVIPL